MSDLTDLTPDNPEGISADTHQPDGGPPPEPADVPARLMITVTELTAHPGNVREDLELTAEFCASIASVGVRIPPLVTPAVDGGYRVIEGHRRLAAAVKAGLEAVPCDVDPGQAADEVGQYVDMLLANSEAYRKNFAPVEEVVLTTYSDDTSVLAALKAGARSYLTKDADRVEIAHALRSSASGLAVLDRALQANLVEAAWRSEPPDPPAMTLPERLPDGLTKREAEILAMMARGLANPEIAAALYLSPHTVKSHINHIFSNDRLHRSCDRHAIRPTAWSC